VHGLEELSQAMSEIAAADGEIPKWSLDKEEPRRVLYNVIHQNASVVGSYSVVRLCPGVSLFRPSGCPR
jgi:hypothetical protein